MLKSSKIKIANQYALAWGDVAKDNLEVAYADVLTLKEVVAINKDYLKKIDAPIYNIEAKTDIINTISIKLELSALTTSVLLLIAKNNRLYLLDDIIEEFISLYNKENNITKVLVETVIDLNKMLENKLIVALESLLQSKVQITYKINKDLLGGLKISYNSMVIDDSISYKLQKIEQLLKGN